MAKFPINKINFKQPEKIILYIIHNIKYDSCVLKIQNALL
jgi:hypothetical protein